MLQLEERSTPNYTYWRQVPEGLRTRGQWEKQGRKVLPHQVPAGTVLEHQVPLFSEAQTRLYTPRPATRTFRQNCEKLLQFVNPRRDLYAFKPDRDWDQPGWPQTTSYLSDAVWRDACNHREGLAILPKGDVCRWFCGDLDFHDPANDPDRFLAQIAAVYDRLTESGDDFFLACRAKDISGLHFWAFGPQELPFTDVLAYAQGVKADLISRHPDLFDDQLEIYPDPKRPFRLPLFPGRCVILDRPLVDLKPREQLARLVEWIEQPGRPMPKGELLDWVKARLPMLRVIVSVPSTNQSPLSVVVPVPTPILEPVIEPARSDLELLSEEDPESAGWWADFMSPPDKPVPTAHEEFTDACRARFVGREEEWRGLRATSGWDAARSYLDQVAPPHDEFDDNWHRALIASWKLTRAAKGCNNKAANVDVMAEWERTYQTSGWEAAMAYVDSITASSGTPTIHTCTSTTGPASEPGLRLQEVTRPVKEPAQPPTPSGKSQRASGSVRYKGCYARTLVDFATGSLIPEADTIGKYLVGWLRGLIVVEEKEAEEAVEFLDTCILDNLTVTDFSDRLMNNRRELTRNMLVSARAIEASNGYQENPEASIATLRLVRAAWGHRGFKLSDPSTWHLAEACGPPAESRRLVRDAQTSAWVAELAVAANCTVEEAWRLAEAVTTHVEERSELSLTFLEGMMRSVGLKAYADKAVRVRKLLERTGVLIRHRRGFQDKSSGYSHGNFYYLGHTVEFAAAEEDGATAGEGGSIYPSSRYPDLKRIRQQVRRLACDKRYRERLRGLRALFRQAA